MIEAKQQKKTENNHVNDATELVKKDLCFKKRKKDI